MKAVALLAIALLLAGCAHPAPTPSSTSTSPPSTPAGPNPSSSRPATPPSSTLPPALGPAFALDGCRNFGGVFPLARDEAMTILPPGFEPATSSADPTGASVMLYVLALRCTGSSVAGNATGAADLLYAELAVTPPKQEAFGDLTDCTVPVLFISSNAAVAAAVQAHHLGQAGVGTIDWQEPQTGAIAVTAAMGAATVSLRGAVATEVGGAPLGDGRFVLYGVQDHAVRGALLGSAAGGTAQDAAITLQSTGAGAVDAARAAAHGYEVSGFSLSYAPLVRAQPVAAH